jgi:hypothetical protein
MFRTLIKNITNVYYSSERRLRNLFSGPKEVTMQDRIQAVKAKHTTDDILEVDVTYCLSLLKLVDEKVLHRYTPLVGLRVTLEVAHPNMYALLVLLNEASRLVRERLVVTEKLQRSRNLPVNMRVALLDDYLTTDNGHQLKPAEVYNAIQLQLETLQKALLSESADTKGNVDYYVRQFTHLMGETEAVTLALIEAQLYAKQGSHSDTRLEEQSGRRSQRHPE